MLSKVIEDTGPIEPDLNKMLAFEDLPEDCQECLLRGWEKRKHRGARGDRKSLKRRD